MFVQHGAYRTARALDAVGACVYRIRFLLFAIAFVVSGLLGIGVYATVAGSGDPIGFLKSSDLYRLISGEGYLPHEIGVDTDVGLALYRNQRTIQKVRTFYSDLTGSAGISDSILKAADKYGVPLALAFALAWKESNFLPTAINFNGGSTDRGLYQLNSLAFPAFHEKDFFDPAMNADGGLRYLSECLNDAGNEIAGLAMYNAGMTRVLGDGTPRVTLDYISTILKYQSEVNTEFETAMLRSGRGILATVAPDARPSTD